MGLRIDKANLAAKEATMKVFRTAYYLAQKNRPFSDHDLLATIDPEKFVLRSKVQRMISLVKQFGTLSSEKAQLECNLFLI